MAAAETYPVRVEASLNSPLSRWLWLVNRWVLIIAQAVLALIALACIVIPVRMATAASAGDPAARS